MAGRVEETITPKIMGGHISGACSRISVLWWICLEERKQWKTSWTRCSDKTSASRNILSSAASQMKPALRESSPSVTNPLFIFLISTTIQAHRGKRKAASGTWWMYGLRMVSWACPAMMMADPWALFLCSLPWAFIPLHQGYLSTQLAVLCFKK